LKKRVLITALVFLGFIHLTGQEKQKMSSEADTASLTKSEKKVVYTGPRKASIMSAVLPGLGQVYNKKYWKVPIIYAGLGGFGYMFYYNNGLYNDFRKNVIAVYDNDVNTVNSMPWYSGEQLQTLKLQYRKSRDFAFIGFAIVYLLNIIDANVDAHLKTFDVSDDLSFSIKPWYESSIKSSRSVLAAGLTLKLNFK
jgi:hypothetical protein